MRFLIRVPEFENPDEFAFRIGELCMRGIRRLPLIAWTFARILHTEERRDREHFAGASELLRCGEHAREFHVDGPLRHVAADVGEFSVVVDRIKFNEFLPPVGDGTTIGHFDERKFLDLTESQREHA